MLTRFPKREQADELAARSNKMDPEWKYTVEASGKWFIVVIHDEDGLRLGTL